MPERTWIRGGGGHDVFFTGGSLGGTFSGGKGNDLLSFAGRSCTKGVKANLAKRVATWVACPGGHAGKAKLRSIESLEGGPGPDILIGNKLANSIRGLRGRDTIYGRGGDDLLGGNEGKDKLLGGAGGDYLDGDPAPMSARVGGVPIPVSRSRTPRPARCNLDFGTARLLSITGGRKKARNKD